MTNATASPLAPQPKQWNVPWLGRTVKLGDFSSWNGQSPFSEPGAGAAQGHVLADQLVDPGAVAHSAMSLSRIRPATPESLRGGRATHGRNASSTASCTPGSPAAGRSRC
jgi:hypothetical protein